MSNQTSTSDAAQVIYNAANNIASTQGGLGVLSGSMVEGVSIATSISTDQRIVMPAPDIFLQEYTAMFDDDKPHEKKSSAIETPVILDLKEKVVNISDVMPMEQFTIPPSERNSYAIILRPDYKRYHETRTKKATPDFLLEAAATGSPIFFMGVHNIGYNGSEMALFRRNGETYFTQSYLIPADAEPIRHYFGKTFKIYQGRMGEQYEIAMEGIEKFYTFENMTNNCCKQYLHEIFNRYYNTTHDMQVALEQKRCEKCGLTLKGVLTFLKERHTPVSQPVSPDQPAGTGTIS